MPAERVAALRTAFDKAVKDTEYVKGVKSRKLDLQPVSGAAVTELINETLAVTPTQLTQIRAAMGLK